MSLRLKLSMAALSIMSCVLSSRHALTLSGEVMSRFIPNRGLIHEVDVMKALMAKLLPKLLLSCFSPGSVGSLFPMMFEKLLIRVE